MLTWYSIITVLFRCPATPADLADNSPRICAPYLSARTAVSPYLEPYYTSYAAPYVDKASPYLSTLDERLVTPALTFGRRTYEAYGASQVQKAQGYGQQQWQNTLKPKIDVASASAQKQYNAKLGPHVKQAAKVVEPYYDLAKNNLWDVYDTHLLPAYTASLPYVLHAYGLSHNFAVTTGIPYAQWVWETVTVFIDRTVWPQLRILYGENVEPQLVRIGERLGRYRDGKRLKAAVDKVDSSSQSSSSSSKLQSISSSVAPAHAAESDTFSSSSSVSASSAAPASDEQEEQVRQQISKDLRAWQEKFAKAADKGADDLEERVKEITDRQIDHQVKGYGEALVVQLEETAKAELSNLKAKIISVVKALPEHADDAALEKAEQEINGDTRSAGSAIKSRAQALRSWRQRYDTETHSLVDAASESTLDVIDSIRDLGLQEIGMRWAWMEGVTYKDWSKYHEMRSTFDAWRGEVEEVAKTHKGLAKAIEAAAELEERGMNEAANVAKELWNLKEAGKVKIQSRDASDDISGPSVASSVRQEAVKKNEDASEAVAGTSADASAESPIQQATESVADAASSMTSQAVESVVSLIDKVSAGVSEAVLVHDSSEEQDTVTSTSTQTVSELPSSAEGVASDISSSATEIPSEAVGVGHEAQQPLQQSVVSPASQKAEEVASGASQVIIGTPPPSHQSLTSKASENLDSAASALSDALPIHDESQTSIEGPASPADSVNTASSSFTDQPPKKGWAGASAQKVGERKPILDDIVSNDDDATFSEKVQSMAGEAGDRIADVTKAVSEALLRPTSTQGSVESVTSLASEQYASAIAAASSVLYGTQQGTGESMASVASGKYSDAVAA